MTWRTWKLWLGAAAGGWALVSGALGHDPDTFSTGLAVVGLALGAFFVPPLLGDAMKRLRAQNRD